MDKRTLSRSTTAAQVRRSRTILKLCFQTFFLVSVAGLEIQATASRINTARLRITPATHIGTVPLTASSRRITIFSLVPQRLLPQAARSEDLVTKTQAICTDATDATGTSLGSERRFPAPRLGSPFKLRTR